MTTTKTTAPAGEVSEDALTAYENTAMFNTDGVKELITQLNDMNLSVKVLEATIKQAHKDGYKVEGLAPSMARHIRVGALLVQKAEGKTARQVMGLARKLNEKDAKTAEKVAGSELSFDQIVEATPTTRKAGKTASEKEAGAAPVSLDNIGDVLTDIFNRLTTQEGRNTFLSKVRATVTTLEAYNTTLKKDGLKVPA